MFSTWRCCGWAYGSTFIQLPPQTYPQIESFPCRGKTHCALNAISERVHQVLGTMMRTAEIDMADSVHPADIDSFIDNAVWAIRSTYHTVL